MRGFLWPSRFHFLSLPKLAIAGALFFAFLATSAVAAGKSGRNDSPGCPALSPETADNEAGAPPECSPCLIAQMRKAWDDSGNGLVSVVGKIATESGFVVNFRNVGDKTYYFVRPLPTQYRAHLDLKLTPGVDRAIFHTHPGGSFRPWPSDGDIATARKNKIPIYSFNDNGLYMYEPPEPGQKDRGYVMIADGDDWKKDCAQRKKQALSVRPNWITFPPKVTTEDTPSTVGANQPD